MLFPKPILYMLMNIPTNWNIRPKKQYPSLTNSNESWCDDSTVLDAAFTTEFPSITEFATTEPQLLHCNWSKMNLDAVTCTIVLARSAPDTDLSTNWIQREVLKGGSFLHPMVIILESIFEPLFAEASLPTSKPHNLK